MKGGRLLEAGCPHPAKTTQRRVRVRDLQAMRLKAG